jgi:hypothetical protein
MSPTPLMIWTQLGQPRDLRQQVLRALDGTGDELGKKAT